MVGGEDELIVTTPTHLGVAVYPPGATFGPRRMSEYEFVWLIEGEAEYTIDGATVPVPEGAIALCRPGTTDFFRWDRRRRTRHAFCHFGVRARPAGWPPPDAWPPARPAAGEGDAVRTLFRHLLTWSGRADPIVQRLGIAHMLAAYVAGQVESGDVPRDVLPEPVDVATAWLHATLESDPAAPIDLADLADVAGVSREHLCRAFRAATGRGPIETVRLARLDRAAILIARSNLPLKSIADACGFSSAFHLSRRFSEAYGVAPSRVRRDVSLGRTPPTPRLTRVHRTDR